MLDLLRRWCLLKDILHYLAQSSYFNPSFPASTKIEFKTADKYKLGLGLIRLFNLTSAQVEPMFDHA